MRIYLILFSLSLLFTLGACTKGEPDITTLANAKGIISLNPNILKSIHGKESICIPSFQDSVIEGICDKRIRSLKYQIASVIDDESWQVLIDNQGVEVNCEEGVLADVANPFIQADFNSGKKLFVKGVLEFGETTALEFPLVMPEPLAVAGGSQTGLSVSSMLNISVSGGMAPYGFSKKSGNSILVGNSLTFSSQAETVEVEVTDSSCAEPVTVSYTTVVPNDGSTGGENAENPTTPGTTTPPADTTPPAAVNLSGTPNSPSNQSSFSVSVSGAEVAFYKYALSDGATCPATLGSTEYSVLTPISILLTSAGVKTLCVSGRDEAGNFQSSPTAYSWEYDNSRPQVVLSTTAISPVSAPTVSMTVTFNEDVADFALSDLVLTNATASSLTGTGKVYSLQLSATSQGSFSIFLPQGKATDAAGNLSFASNTISLQYQANGTIPQVTMVNFGGINNLTGSPSLMAEFDVTGAEQMYLTEDPSCTSGGVWQSYSIVGLLNVASTPEGNRTAYVRFKSSTNGETSCLSGNYLYDSISPSAPTNIADGVFSNSGTTTPVITFTSSTDTGSGVAKYQAQVVDAESPSTVILNWREVVSGQSITNASAVFVDGKSYKINLKSVDYAYNESSAVVSDGWLVDKTAPTAVTGLTLASGTSDLNNTPIINFDQSSDLGSGIQSYEIAIYSNNGSLVLVSSWQTFSSGTSLGGMNFTSGTPYVAKIRAIDNAGNIGSAVMSPSWTASSIDPCAGTPTIGTICAGGAIYAGLYDWDYGGSASNGEQYMIMPSGCNGSVSNPSCTGGVDTYSQYWIDGSYSSYYIDTPLINFTESTKDTQDGRTSSLNLATVFDANNYLSSLQAHLAAKYCNDLVVAGYSDWYLPTKSEMAYLYCQSAGSGSTSTYPIENGGCGGQAPTGALTTFATHTYYWTSSEYAAASAWSINFASGMQQTKTKNQVGLVRCVRRY